MPGSTLGAATTIVMSTALIHMCMVCVGDNGFGGDSGSVFVKLTVKQKLHGPLSDQARTPAEGENGTGEERSAGGVWAV